MEKEPEEKNRLDELREAIVNSPSSIESEFTRTANDWLSCFGTRVFIIETYFSSSKTKSLINPTKYEEAITKLEELKVRLYELKQQYPEKTTIPPDEIKKELLDQLDILR